MSKIKNHLDDVLVKMSLEERIKFLIYTCGYSSEDAEDYTKLLG